jgi:hypothetical protein
VLLIASLAITGTTISYVHFLWNEKFMFLIKAESSIHHEMQLVAAAVHADRLSLEQATKQRYDSFTLASSYPYAISYYDRDGWPTSGQWIFLEGLSSRPLVYITDSRNKGAQFRPLNPNVETLYFTCLLTDEVIKHTLADEQASCVEVLLASRPYLSSTYRTILTTSHTTVFAFEKNQSTKEPMVTDEIVFGSNYGIM